MRFHSGRPRLESYPRRNIKPVQYGANLVFDTAGARKQQNQTSCSPQDARQRAEETLWYPAKEPRDLHGIADRGNREITAVKTAVIGNGFPFSPRVAAVIGTSV